MSSSFRSPVVLASLLAVAVASSPARATLVSVATPGNLLALLPSADIAVSSEASFGTTPSQIDDNFVNTANQDNGQIFADTDTNQRVAITGFDSSLGDLRFFLDPTDPGRFPSSLTVYYSTMSTTSIDPGNSSYTGANGGVLVPTFALSTGLLTPVPGAHSGYLDIAVDAPMGTRTLLADVGPANGEGDRISELQAFAAPEPDSAWLFIPAVASAMLLWRRRSRG